MYEVTPAHPVNHRHTLDICWSSEGQKSMKIACEIHFRAPRRFTRRHQARSCWFGNTDVGWLCIMGIRCDTLYKRAPPRTAFSDFPPNSSLRFRYLLGKDYAMHLAVSHIARMSIVTFTDSHLIGSLNSPSGRLSACTTYQLQMSCSAVRFDSCPCITASHCLTSYGWMIDCRCSKLSISLFILQDKFPTLPLSAQRAQCLSSLQYQTPPGTSPRYSSFRFNWYKPSSLSTSCCR